MAYERKFKVDLTIRDVWKKYKSERNTKVDEKTFKGVLCDLNKIIADKMIRESFEYRLPFKMGFLRVKKSKLRIRIKDGRVDRNKNIIDWKSTLDYWETKYGTRDRKVLRTIPDKLVIFHINEHTNGEVMRWYWDKTTCLVPNKHMFMFFPVKGGVDKEGFYSGRIGLSKWINSEDRTNDYYF